MTRATVFGCLAYVLVALGLTALRPVEARIYSPPGFARVWWEGDTLRFSLDAIKRISCRVGGHRRPFAVIDGDFSSPYDVRRSNGAIVRAARRNIAPGETLRIRGFGLNPAPRQLAGRTLMFHAPCYDDDGRARVADLGPLSIPPRTKGYP